MKEAHGRRSRPTKKERVLTAILLVAGAASCAPAQEVPILSAGVDAAGCVELQVASTPIHYYVLYARDDLGRWAQERPVSITLGQGRTTMLTEPLAAYYVKHYRVVQHRIKIDADTDGDGIDDMEEFYHPIRLSPLNPAPEVDFHHGAVSIPDRQTFRTLAYQGSMNSGDPHLDQLEFLKFFIIEADTDNPQVYFMNTKTHQFHPSFGNAVGIMSTRVSGHRRGEIVYHPYVPAPNGEFGLYRFEFEPGDFYAFEEVRKAHELMAANMPFLRNNFAYYPMPQAALPRYYQEKALYDASRIPILLEEDIYASTSYLPLNIAEGYGVLRRMELDERPNWRDIVIYEALPNEMPRVGGIITTVAQTPLSHVNLRAIQDRVPNAYIPGVLNDDIVTSLIGKHVYFNVRADGFEIRQATHEEVEAHYADQRPTESQVPVRDLSVTAITPLDEIRFEHSSSFGVKAANLATLRTFGFPEGTVPNGFGVPFYFYDEFMKHNGFYEQARAMLADPNFQGNYDVQEKQLAVFRKTIRAGGMPDWMVEALTEMQNAFGQGASIRCRSSTNNEDLPGFSGAGLYDSWTHHPYEGHISKTIKQVFSSLWNFRAFDERQFYRIDHFAAAMGVLVHPNFSEEQANGVGVTTDPIYQTEDTYYLNTQVGEDLVTNPEAQSVPEEILLEAAARRLSYTIVRPSNQVPDGRQVLSEAHLEQMLAYLQVIHNEFARLYQADSDPDFAMEIEYKITREGQLAIKQARPWVVH